MPYKEHPNLKIINDNDKVWRYITLARLISLLERQQLYFHNIRRQFDQFEGRYSAIDFDPERNPDYKTTYKNAQIDLDVEHAKFINCWHINNHESEAMWELYTHKTEGIAILSTFGKIKNSFKNTKEPIYIGKVEYKDRRNELTLEQDIDSIIVNFTKDISYEFEKELRMLLFPNDESRLDLSKSTDTYGFYVDVDLSEMIGGVYISPFAEGWFIEVIRGILNKYNIDSKKILKSFLSEKPLY